MTEQIAGKGEDDPARDEPAIFTICSRNYLPQARILVASLRQHMPRSAIRVVLADEVDDAALIEDYVGAPIIPGRKIGLPTYDDMAMRYDIVEFNTALKPAAFQHLFEAGFAAAIYLDPDIEVMRPLTEVVELFRKGAQGVVTPHITRPLDMEKNPTELKLIRTGIYNLGFLALRACGDSDRFLAWWADRMPSECRVDLDAGIFVDQKYIDLMPSYLPHTDILRHPGYNVAYWNLAHRPITREEGGAWCADGEPLVFMHYSGIRADDPDTVSVHQDRLRRADLGEGAVLFDDYRARLRANRERITEQGVRTDYAYATFTTGEPVTPLLRQVYARAVPPSCAPYTEVFDLSARPFTTAVTGLTHRAAGLISPVMSDIWLRKPHLQAAFNLHDPGDAEAYALWFAQAGYKEFKVSPALIPRAAKDLSNRPQSLQTRWALLTLKMIDWGKRTSFLYPKPVRRATTRMVRRFLPRLAKGMRGRRRDA